MSHETQCWAIIAPYHPDFFLPGEWALLHKEVSALQMAFALAVHEYTEGGLPSLHLSGDFHGVQASVLFVSLRVCTGALRCWYVEGDSGGEHWPRNMRISTPGGRIYDFIYTPEGKPCITPDVLADLQEYSSDNNSLLIDEIRWYFDVATSSLAQWINQEPPIIPIESDDWDLVSEDDK